VTPPPPSQFSPANGVTVGTHRFQFDVFQRRASDAGAHATVEVIGDGDAKIISLQYNIDIVYFLLGVRAQLLPI